MTTHEIAERLVSLCRTGAYETAQAELYSQHAESIEPANAPMQYAKGLDAIKEKGAYFQSGVEAVHSTTVSEAVVAGNFFSLAMALDLTMKESGRMNMEEIAVYEVKDGKIIKETFIY